MAGTCRDDVGDPSAVSLRIRELPLAVTAAVSRGCLSPTLAVIDESPVLAFGCAVVVVVVVGRSSRAVHLVCLCVFKKWERERVVQD